MVSKLPKVSHLYLLTAQWVVHYSCGQANMVSFLLAVQIFLSKNGPQKWIQQIKIHLKLPWKENYPFFCGYGQILGLKFIYIESIHPFYQAQCTVHRWIPTIKCIFQLRTDKIECMAVWEAEPCCFCLHPATSDAGNLGQKFTLTNQFLANLKLESDLGCKKESIAHFSNILLILYRLQWWAWLSPMLICHPFLHLQHCLLSLTPPLQLPCDVTYHTTHAT